MVFNNNSAITPSSNLPERIVHLFEKWSRDMGYFSQDSQKIGYFQKELPLILNDNAFFVHIMEKITKGSPFPDIRSSGLFENEIILFLNPSRLFSVRFAIYEPGEYTIIHDHSSWGVFGTVFGPLEVIKYRRVNDDSRDAHARLAETGRLFLHPSDTDFTLPLNEGIHRIGNPTDQLICTSSIYGSPTRRLFINGYDIVNERVYPIYPPRIKKKQQAQRALNILLSGS